MADNQPNDLTFEVNLLFRENKNAIEAFNQILQFYEVLNDFDRAIVRNIGQNILTTYELEDVEETTEILKIKKVDMLSDEPKWDFLQGKKSLSAKMLDKQWLDDFHNRQVIIRPEDALMVTLRTTHTYTPNFEDKKTECEIIKIISVITPESDNTYQMKISNDL
jgi:hypothetical protein